MKLHRLRKLLPSSVRFFLVLFLSFVILVGFWSTFIPKTVSSHSFPTILAQTNPQTEASPETSKSESFLSGKVVLGNQTLFTVDSPIAAATPEIRAAEISQKIEKVAKNSSITVDNIQIRKLSDRSKTEIIAGDEVIFPIYEVDVKPPYQTQAEIAEYYLDAIKKGVSHYRQLYSPQSILFGILKLIIATIISLLIFTFIQRIFRFFTISPAFERSTHLLAFRIGDYQLISASQVSLILSQLANLAKLIIFLTLLSIYLNLALSFFPWTQSFSVSIVQSIFSIVGQIAQNIIAYLPKLLFLLVIIYITYYALRFVNFIFTEIEQSKLSIPGFYQDWAAPTARLLNILLITLAAIIAFPYLPGSGSEAFQGISIFLGILFSLGSTAAISNMIAGVFLTYTRAFEIGDEIEINGVSGVVVEKGLLVVRLLTFKNHFISGT